MSGGHKGPGLGRSFCGQCVAFVMSSRETRNFLRAGTMSGLYLNPQCPEQRLVQSKELRGESVNEWVYTRTSKGISNMCT